MKGAREQNFLGSSGTELKFLGSPGTDSSLDDFHIIGPDPISFQLSQLGDLKEGYELTSTFALRKVPGSHDTESSEEPCDMKTLTALLVRAASLGSYRDLLYRAGRGLRNLKRTYFPRHQEELDLLICFLMKYQGRKSCTLDTLRERVVTLLRAEASRSRVLNELGLFMSIYTEITPLIENPETLGLSSQIQTKIQVLDQSIERIQTLISGTPIQDMEEFHELSSEAEFLLEELKKKVQPILLSPPTIQIRIHGAQTPLIVHPGRK